MNSLPTKAAANRTPQRICALAGLPPVGEDAAHAGFKTAPFLGAEEGIAQQEAAAEEIVAKFGGLGIGELPAAGHAGVEIGPVVDVVTVVGIDGLFDTTYIEAGEAA